MTIWRNFSLAIVLLLIPASSLAGCAKDKMHTYKPEQIHEVTAVESAEGLTVEVRPLMESMHYLAGANLEERGGAIYLTLVRKGVKAENDAEIRATPVEDDAGLFRITIRNEGRPVFVEYPGEARKIF